MVVRFVHSKVCPVVIVLIMAAAGIGPHEAASNLGGWWRAILREKPPQWLAHPIADHVAIYIGAALVLVWLLWHISERLLLSSKEKSVKKITIFDAERICRLTPMNVVPEGAGNIRLMLRQAVESGELEAWSSANGKDLAAAPYRNDIFLDPQQVRTWAGKATQSVGISVIGSTGTHIDQNLLIGFQTGIDVRHSHDTDVGKNTISRDNGNK